MSFQFDRSRTFPQLGSAPIVEAVIQWRAAASIDLEQNELREMLEKRFPSHEITPHYDLEMAFSRQGSGVRMKQPKYQQGYRISSADETPKYVCQFRRTGVTFSQLAPYSGWETFIAEAFKFWELFVDSFEPVEVSRLSTRFISQIPITGIDDVQRFTDLPESPWKENGVSVDSFFHQNTMKLDDHPYVVALVKTVQPRSPGRERPLTLIIDIEASTTQSLKGPNELSSMESCLSDLRYLKNVFFFEVVKSPEDNFGD